jgi:hypothetical protein
VKRRNKLLRALVTGVLAIVLVPISWAMTFAATPGGAFVAYTVSPRDDGFGGIEIAAILDFTVWFAALWGVQTLWAQLHEQVQERGIDRLVPIRPDASTLIGALLCSIPFAFYVVFVADIFLNRGRLPDSGLLFVGAVALSLAGCAIAVLGLFAAAVQFWPRSVM